MAYTTINKSTEHFNTKLWSGNATDDRAISGLDFAPNWVWIKNRTDTNSYALFDTVRGATKYIESDTTDAEATGATFLKSFTSDGFTLGTAGRVNANSQNYVSWNWKANGAGSANTDGSISSTVSANTTSGFSIVSYTGTGSNATVGHGLGVAPDMLIFKSLDGGAQSWFVLHKDLTSYTDRYLRLQDTVAEVTYSMQTQVPTNSLLYLNSGGVGNGNSGLICYAFASKQGYSKFGSYVGNGSTDGTFVYTGFKPAFVIVKRTDTAQGWYMLDNKRNTFNPEDKYLEANDSDAEATFTFCDFLSNGFKAKTTGVGFNASGGTYIYMAFAENPFVTSTGIPTTAR